MIEHSWNFKRMQQDTTGVFLTCGRLGFEDCIGGMALVLGFRLADIGWSPEAVASLATLQLPICEILDPIFIFLQLPNFTWRKTHGLFRAPGFCATVGSPAIPRAPWYSW